MMTESREEDRRPIALLGAGNLGLAIAKGIVRSGLREPREVLLTRRRVEHLEDMEAAGFGVPGSNEAAVAAAGIVILAVQPQQALGVVRELSDRWDPSRHILVSTATGISIEAIRGEVSTGLPVIRAMPNLGIQTLNSMTCLVADKDSEAALPRVDALFRGLGETIRIEEGNMAAATALCACGIAFFLRAIRAAGQGGVEIGFHADEAIRMAAQTAKGAAELILQNRTHPEMEIDQVTTPNGCTIAGLNEMENRGFSSALVRGMVVSSRRAGAVQPSTPPAGSSS